MPLQNHILTNIPTFPARASVGDALKLLTRQKKWDSINYIYLLSKSGKILGVVSIKELLAAAKTTSLSKIASKDLIVVRSSTPAGRAAILAIRNNIKSVPVVDKDNRFLGIVGTDQILNTLHSAGIEDAIRHSGIYLERRELLDVLKGRAGLLVRRRLPWILFGLLGGFIASLFISRFESFLLEAVELAFFIPAVMYIGQAFGAQTSSLFIRSVFTGDVSIRRFLIKELFIGGIVGMSIALLAFVSILFVFRDVSVATIVGISMFSTIFVAGPLSILLIFFMMKRQKDPALGVGPFGALIQDLFSVLFYFLIASFILSL